MSLRGKVLRINDDGTVPRDNPFVDREGYRPEIYTLGHRNTLGLIQRPETGELWQHENGPNGGDEINVLSPGRNYGWPLVRLWTRLFRRKDHRPSDARRDGIASGGLVARHSRRRDGRLHRRPVPGVEGKCIRRIAPARAAYRARAICSALSSMRGPRNYAVSRS